MTAEIKIWTISMTNFLKKFLVLKIFFSSLLLLSIFSGTSMANDTNPNKCLVLELKYGEVVIKFRPDLAPNHVARITELTNEGFYNGILFHRVIAGFMAQTGDPTGTGAGGSGKKLKAEFSKTPHVRGTVSMARAHSPDSADSQFFIVFAPSRFLDGQYTVFGEVTSGMEYVDLIKKGDQDTGAVTNPDKIISAKIIDAADCH